MHTRTNGISRAARFLLGGAVAALVTAPAMAQSTSAQDAETANDIVVTGYGASLEEAINIKRETIGFSDSIVATDIADFPEQNLSEALQRISTKCRTRTARPATPPSRSAARAGTASCCPRSTSMPS
ncbi:MAG TPA: hypothetical protein VMQ93_14935 [Novosphingobium sp.]|nr:hypothetical protein [Novosphingobium sp.]